MISLFTNKNIKDAHATIAKLQGEAVELNKQIETLQKAVAEFPAQLDVLKKEHADKLAVLTNEHSAKTQELETSIETAKTVTTEAVMKQASLKIEALGISEEQAFKPSVSSEMAYETALAKLQTFSRGSKERADFYKKNKGLLTQPVNSSTETVTE